MKALVLLLLVIFVFLGCALVGFQVANRLNSPALADELDDPGAEIRGEQYNLVLVRVDQLDASQPRLISIWFVSLYFLENNPTILTLAPIYPASSPSATALLEQAFAFSSKGEPVSDFWNALNAYGFNWESFIILDNAGANLFLQWLVGPGDFTKSLEAASSNSDNRLSMVDQTCKSIADASQRELGHFNWSDLVPDHFRSNLRLEAGLAYWDRLVDTGPARCEILPAP